MEFLAHLAVLGYGGNLFIGPDKVTCAQGASRVQSCLTGLRKTLLAPFL